MSRILLAVVVIAMIGGAVYLKLNDSSGPVYESVQIVNIGDVAPDFKLEDTRGEVVSLAALRGKVVLVNFWATWCPPCRAEMPSMEKLNEAMDGEDFVLLAINVEENGRSAVPAFLEKNPHTFTILYDEKGVTQRSYGVFKFPESLVIRKDGIIDDKVTGAIDWAHPDTIAYFKELTGE